MKYLHLAEIYREISSTTKRLEKIEILAKFLKQVSSEDKDVMYLLLGDIYPEYDERKIGISNQLTIKAISKATGASNERVLKEWKELGDLGKVAEKLIGAKKQSTLTSQSSLTTHKVLENIRKLPELEGVGTVEKKLSLITELLSSASPIEALYLVRTLIGDLRIGIKESTIREALAKAFFDREKKANAQKQILADMVSSHKETAKKILADMVSSHKEANAQTQMSSHKETNAHKQILADMVSSHKETAKKIQDAIDKSNDIALVFDACKKKDLNKIEKIQLEIGKPIKAMLAQKVSTIEEGFEALGKPCAIEYKYDGFRLIIHKDKNKIILFTRRLENVTKQFPEVEEYTRKYVKGDNFILDTEAVGYNPKTKKYSPFQAISQRIRRKYDIEKLQKELPVEINVFDILYHNGKSLLNEPFEKRTEIVKQIIENHPYKIIHAKQIITSDIKKAKEFYKKALRDNQEGVMMKKLDAKYQPGSRVGHMLKVKPSEKEIDLVITGAEYGKGKRSGWFSSFILSCRGKNKNEFLEIGKVGTGIREKEESGGVTFHELTEKIKPLIVKEEKNKVEVKPRIVVAVTYQEIQSSPNYNSRWALRFPRIKALRIDKPVSEIADLNEIEKDAKKQKRNWRYG